MPPKKIYTKRESKEIIEEHVNNLNRKELHALAEMVKHNVINGKIVMWLISCGMNP